MSLSHQARNTDAVPLAPVVELFSAHDWAASPLGDPSGWPQSVHAALRGMADSPLAMQVAWGDGLHGVYNDAYARLLGDRHPACFGKPLLDMWRDAADTLSRILERVMAGETVHLENHCLAVMRQGRRQSAWFTFAKSPLRNDSGRVCGICSIMTETTPLMMARLRDKAALDLLDGLRAATSVDEVLIRVSRTLAAQFDVSRVTLVRHDTDAEMLQLRSTYVGPGCLALEGTYPANIFGNRLFAELGHDKVWVMNDTRDPGLATNPGTRGLLQSLAIGAGAAVPVQCARRRLMALLLCSETARNWRSGDTHFMQALVRRAVAVIDRLQHEHEEKIRVNAIEAQAARDAVERECLAELGCELQAVLESGNYFRYANAAWTRLLQYSVEELGVMQLRDLVHRSDQEKVQQLLREPAGFPAPASPEFRLRDKSGVFHRLRWVSRHRDGDVFVSGTVLPAAARGAVARAAKARAESGLPAADDWLGQALKQGAGMLAAVRGASHVFAFVNDACAALLGRTDLVGQTVHSALPQPQATALVAVLNRVRDTGMPERRRELFMPPPEARSGPCVQINVDFYCRPIHDAEGNVSAIVLQGVDVTREVMALDEARVAGERWRLAVESRGSVVWMRDLLTDTITFSPEWKRMLGYAEAEFSDTFQTWQAHLHPEDRSRVIAAVKACISGATPRIDVEYRILTRSGQYLWVESQGMVIERDAVGTPTKLSGILSDVSKKKLTEETQWRQANFDALTGLPNRRLLANRLDRAVLKAGRSNRPLALLFIDLDNFKHANDVHGHELGDQLLAEAAARIASCVRSCDTAARLGGDEFTVLLTDLDARAHVDSCAQKIIDVIAVPFRIGGADVALSASVGITLFEQDANSTQEMMRNADRAMYAAKKAGGNRFCYFTTAMQDSAQRRLQLGADLRQALAEDELRLVYQPIFDIGTMVVVNAEALLRWQHPKLGLLEAVAFLPIAQDTGQLDAIDAWVFRQAASCARRLDHILGYRFPISVNQSGLRFDVSRQSIGWTEQMAEIGLGAGSIAVEVSATILQSRMHALPALVAACRDAGVELVLDNLGTGHFSVAQLQRFGIKRVKIDPGFIADAVPDSANRLATEAIICMAHCLGLKVVVGGIETAEQSAWLTDAGCDLGQGYFLSGPIDEAALLQMLHR